jgi:multiple sugar transport system permease protein
LITPSIKHQALHSAICNLQFELFLQKPNLMTLTIGMAFFRFQYTNDLSAILVGAMFNAIPMLILFFIFSKYYMEGASYSGLAGQ